MSIIYEVRRQYDGETTQHDYKRRTRFEKQVLEALLSLERQKEDHVSCDA
jgi:hypothetical protein